MSIAHTATLILPSPADVLERTSRAWFGNAVILAFLCMQALDGVFTYVGMAAVGIAEGNPILGHYMELLGVGPSLTLAKLVAAACAIVLHRLAFHRMLAALTMVYVTVAVVPWTWAIFFMAR